jgi:hypothetical protein
VDGFALANSEGVLSLDSHERAQIFTSRNDAELAISSMPPELAADGIRFAVVPVDTDAAIGCPKRYSRGIKVASQENAMMERSRG